MKLIRLFCFVFFFGSLSACGFHLRSGASLAPALHCLYLDSPNPYSVFHTELASTLRGLSVRLVKKPQDAPLHLVILSNTMSHTDPSLVSSNSAVSYTFNLTTVAQIQSAQGRMIVPTATFSTARTIVVNSNQVLNSSMGISAKQDLIRSNVSKVYFWLASNHTHEALLRYANHSARIKTAH